MLNTAGDLAPQQCCQTWHDVTPAVPSRWYYQCLSPCCLEESAIGNSLYTLARSARRWGGGNVAQAEPGTPARGHLADGRFLYYKYQLATQIDRRTSSSLTKV